MPAFHPDTFSALDGSLRVSAGLDVVIFVAGIAMPLPAAFRVFGVALCAVMPKLVSLPPTDDAKTSLPHRQRPWEW